VVSATQIAVLLEIKNLYPPNTNDSGPMWGKLQVSRPGVNKGKVCKALPMEQLSKIDIFPSGTGLRWPELDVDLSIPHLMEGIFGTKLWMKEMTAKGGRSISEAKKAASRMNGKKGGRPKKEE
jgi:hypothetical protein